jgi:hypothetical protein
MFRRDWPTDPNACRVTLGMRVLPAVWLLLAAVPVALHLDASISVGCVLLSRLCVMEKRSMERALIIATLIQEQRDR